MPGGGEENPALYLGYDQDTIYDRLNEQGNNWRVYYGDVPQSIALSHQRAHNNRQRYARKSRTSSTMPRDRRRLSRISPSLNHDIFMYRPRGRKTMTIHPMRRSRPQSFWQTFTIPFERTTIFGIHACWLSSTTRTADSTIMSPRQPQFRQMDIRPYTPSINLAFEYLLS